MAFVPRPAAAAPNPIDVLQCFVTPPKPLAKTASGTQIVYANRAGKTVTRITFTVFYRNAEHDFSRTIPDVGTFAPNATIKHHFDLYNDVTYAGKAVSYCKATYVEFADGTVWKA